MNATFPRLAIATLTFGLSAGFAFAQDVTGAGATFPAPVYAKWSDAYNKATGARINYQSVGSGAGIKQKMCIRDSLEEVRAKRIKSVTLQESPGGGTEIIALTNDDKRLRSTATYLDRGLVGDLIANGCLLYTSSWSTAIRRPS